MKTLIIFFLYSFQALAITVHGSGVSKKEAISDMLLNYQMKTIIKLNSTTILSNSKNLESSTVISSKFKIDYIKDFSCSKVNRIFECYGTFSLIKIPILVNSVSRECSKKIDLCYQISEIKYSRSSGYVFARIKILIDYYKIDSKYLDLILVDSSEKKILDKIDLMVQRKLGSWSKSKAHKSYDIKYNNLNLIRSLD
jgi:hypothetical protein